MCRPRVLTPTTLETEELEQLVGQEYGHAGQMERVRQKLNHIIATNFLSKFIIRTSSGSQNQTAIHCKFHVTGA